MQITSRFTIAIHIITAIDYFKDITKVTSSFLAGSVGANPVVIRNVTGCLKKAGIIESSQGKSGIGLARSLDEISFFDIYMALDCIDEEGLFHFHENPNAACPVGRNIHKSVGPKLQEIQLAMEAEMKAITMEDVIRDIQQEMRNESNAQ